jgi:hypothetical protein
MCWRIGLLVLAVAVQALPSDVSTKKSTYSKTRRLLLSMEPAHPSQALTALFRETDARAVDLVTALDDPDRRVNLGAQLVIRFVGNPSLSASLEAWLENRRKAGDDVSSPRVEPPTSPTYLDGTKRSLPKQVLKRLHPGKSTSARIIAFNTAQQAVLILVVYGDTSANVFTSGYYVVVRRDSGRWKVVVNTNAWET